MSDSNDFKTYSIENFKDPSLAFLIATFSSSIISG
jgi:hypothetical protein